MKVRSVGLFLRAVTFTIVVPGTVTVLIPSWILGPERQSPPQPWTLTSLVGLLFLSIGAAVYFRCLWEFAARGRGIPFPIDHPKQLVVSGLYRYVRNPMYVGVLTVLLGEVMIFRSLDLLIYTVSWFAFVHLNVVIWGRAPAAPQVWRFLHALS
ncbi:MAG TPA: methyltransferase [Terriglobia bacterium]|nr:methyltransferase [Terriglobia bacterium]